MDHLIVSLPSNRNLSEYTISYDQSSGYITFTASGEVISVKDVERFTFNGSAWSYLRTGQNYAPDGTLIGEPQIQFGVDGFFSGATGTLIMFDAGSINNSTWLASNTEYGFTKGGNITVIGSAFNDEIRLTGMPWINEATVNAGDGNDSVIIYERGEESDTINLGAGDDSVRVGSDYTSDILDGGNGSDTVSFRWLWFDDGSFAGATFALGSNATNFENIEGSKFSDTLTGDAGDNVINGDSSDNYGNAGDVLYGLAGNDTLLGGVGNDTLDGGLGRDTITTGPDTDTIVTRAGDGGSSEAEADVITDFTDGTDIIGLAGGLSYGELTIEQGEGDHANDVIVKRGAEFLLVIQNQQVANVNYFDFVSTSSSAIPLTGDGDSNTLLGGSGGDAATTGAGDDVIVTYGGNDTITIDGTGTKLVNGGSGLDHLIVSLPSNRNLSEYAVSYDSSTGYVTFTASDEVISVKDVERFTFNGSQWSYLRTGQNYAPDGTLIEEPQVQFGVDAFFSGATGTLLMFDAGSINNSSWVASSTEYGFTKGGNITVIGSAFNDEIRLTGMPWINEATVNAGDGNDSVIIYERGEESDTINLGAGDDSVLVGSDYTSDVMDGGNGSDTVSFRWLWFDDDSFAGATFTLGSNAVNFENIEGSKFSDTLTGDAGDNVINGDSSDNYGNAGDALYGLAGNDTLLGGVGNDTLDGGLGRDTITTGAGYGYGCYTRR